MLTANYAVGYFTIIVDGNMIAYNAITQRTTVKCNVWQIILTHWIIQLIQYFFANYPSFMTTLFIIIQSEILTLLPMIEFGPILEDFTNVLEPICVEASMWHVSFSIPFRVDSVLVNILRKSFSIRFFQCLVI